MPDIPIKDADARSDEQDEKKPAKKPLRIVLPEIVLDAVAKHDADDKAIDDDAAADDDGNVVTPAAVVDDNVAAVDGNDSDKAAEDEKEAAAESHDEEDIDPLAAWIAVAPQYRRKEVDALAGISPEFPITIAHDGKLQKPLSIDKWVFLLEYDSHFPNSASGDGFPFRAYLVVPSAEEIVAGTALPEVPQVERDADGQEYVALQKAAACHEHYLQNKDSETIAQSVYAELAEWIEGLTDAVAIAEAQNAERSREKADTFEERRKLFPGLKLAFFNLNGVRKYTDGRVSAGELPNPKCSKVVLSDRALIQIYNETRARFSTETGGLLLGHYVDDVWYVVESSDPGNNGVFEVTYHESDPDYANHVCSILSRSYKYPLVFLGMWHRHPGSLDSFSGTDDITNGKYAISCGNGCISALVNYDPDFRLTFYYVEQGTHGEVYYTKVDVETGDDKFENPDILKLATMDEVTARVHVDGMAAMPSYLTAEHAEAQTMGHDAKPHASNKENAGDANASAEHDDMFGKLRKMFTPKTKTKIQIGESESTEVTTPRCSDNIEAEDEQHVQADSE